MTIEELNYCMVTGDAVLYGGAPYTVNALIKRKHGPVSVMEVELLDKNRNSVIIASPGKINAVPAEPPSPAVGELDQYMPGISQALDDLKKAKEKQLDKRKEAAV